MNYLKLVADKTVAEKYTVPNVIFDCFEKREGVHYVKPGYIEAIKKYKSIDMSYNAFDWQNGVGFFGLIEAGKVLKDEKYIEFIKEWTEYHIKKGLPPITVNSTIPYYGILGLYKRYGTPEYYGLCDSAAKFIMSEGKRADEGTLEHTVLDGDNPSQIWADTVFMGGIFLAEWGKFTGNIMYLNEAARQILLHYKYLTDKETGLMFHAYSCFNRDNLSRVRWGRANGWGIVSCVEILDRIPGYHKDRDKIKENLKKHIDSMLAYQAEDGGFCTVMNNPATYSETTITCCVYYAIKKALSKGYIDGDYEDVLEKAKNYIISKIASDGEVTGTSAGTPVMASDEEYNKIPCAMSYYGQGLALMALSVM